jgi:exopolysaccharide production protein ExoZ
MSDPIEQNNKILSVQYLRGLAALGVVACHYGAAFTLYPALAAALNFGQTGVYVFFLISGFIIVYSLEKAKYKIGKFFIFLLKRSIRIDPAYYITILLTILLFKYLSAVSPVTGEKFVLIPQQLIAHLLYVVPFTQYDFYMHVFWTLCIEFQFYLLIGLFYFISTRKLFKIPFLVLFSLSSFLRWPDGYYLVFTYGVIFATGISLVALYQNRTWLNAILPALFLVLVGRKFGIPVFLLITISSFIIVFYKSTIRPLGFLGDISYSLYLIHTLISVILIKVIVKFSINVSGLPTIWLFFEVLIAILCSYLFYKLIEKPSLNYSKMFFYKRPK